MGSPAMPPAQPCRPTLALRKKGALALHVASITIGSFGRWMTGQVSGRVCTVPGVDWAHQRTEPKPSVTARLSIVMWRCGLGPPTGLPAPSRHSTHTSYVPFGKAPDGQ